MLSVMGAFAEFERALIRERQREGIALAKQRGAYRGRKKLLSPEQTAQLRQRVQAGERKAPLAREFGISRKPSINTCARKTDDASSQFTDARRARLASRLSDHKQVEQGNFRPLPPLTRP